MSHDMQVEIGKVFRFEAAHQLHGHEGACAKLHGHSYKVIIHLIGPIRKASGTSEGMVCDFGDLTKAWKKHIFSLLDHQNLNYILPVRTTAENLAVWIFARLVNKWSNAKLLSGVEVWETATSFAIFRHIPKGLPLETIGYTKAEDPRLK